MNKKKVIYVTLWFAAALAAVLILTVGENPNAASRLRVRWLIRRHGAHTTHTTESLAVVQDLHTVNDANATHRPLCPGSRGSQVEAMQRFINRMCRAHVSEDGYWGPRTEEAVRRYCTNATGYLPPVYGKYWAMNGSSYSMTAQSFRDMLANYRELLQ